MSDEVKQPAIKLDEKVVTREELAKKILELEKGKKIVEVNPGEYKTLFRILG
jgi:hypothetical protein